MTLLETCLTKCFSVLATQTHKSCRCHFPTPSTTVRLLFSFFLNVMLIRCFQLILTHPSSSSYKAGLKTKIRRTSSIVPTRPPLTQEIWFNQPTYLSPLLLPCHPKRIDKSTSSVTASSSKSLPMPLPACCIARMVLASTRTKKRGEH